MMTLNPFSTGIKSGTNTRSILALANILGRADSSVVAKFTPTLRAYVTSQYKKNELIEGEVQGDKIWEKNLATLADDTDWKLEYDGGSGRWSLKEGKP